MKRTAKEIGDEIKILVDQLVSMIIPNAQHKEQNLLPQKTKDKKGAAGAISMLIGEGFFDKPKRLSEVKVRMEEIGRYCPLPTISMNLLNLTKRRTLNRIRDTKTKEWQYVLRK
jgi:hypothetical protein